MTPEPVLDPAFWQRRLVEADGDPARAVYHGDAADLAHLGREQAAVLNRKIRVHESILDAGCGYGRLLELMRPEWKGQYLGVDISPEFIAEAQRRHPGRDFWCADLRDLGPLRVGPRLYGTPKWDVAVAIGVRGMLRRNGLHAEWEQIEQELLTVARRVLVPETPDHRFEEG